MAVLRLPEVLMHAQARGCLDDLVRAMTNSQDRVVLLDAAALQQFDSSALAVLLACRREAHSLGRSLEVQGLTARLAQLARLYGVLPLLQP